MAKLERSRKEMRELGYTHLGTWGSYHAVPVSCNGQWVSGQNCPLTSGDPSTIFTVETVDDMLVDAASHWNIDFLRWLYNRLTERYPNQSYPRPRGYAAAVDA